MRIDINTGAYEKEQIVAGNEKRVGNVSDGVLKTGQIFTGTIKEILGERIKILLENRNTLEATLTNGVSFNVGEKAEFIVKDNKNGKIFLKVLSIGDKISKESEMALKEIGVKLDKESINIIKEMMANGMKIDKGTINNLIRLAKSFPDTSVAQIVEMNSKEIPVTKENIEQFNIFKQGNNEISKNITNVFTALENELTNNTKDVVKKMAKALNINIELKSDANENVRTNENLNTKDIASKKEPDMQTINVNPEKEATNQQSDVKSKMETDETIVHRQGQNVNDGEIAADKKEVSEFIEKLEKRFKFDIKDMYEREPERIKEQIKQITSEIQKNTDKLLEVLKESGMEKTNAYKELVQVKENLNFSNEINSFASYVQVPLTDNKYSEGELYVYSRKKKKQTDSEQASALIRLNMENLGATQVYVNLIKDKVRVTFTMDDKLSEKVISDNLHLLKERIEKLGYAVNISVESVKEEKNPFEEILKFENPRSEIKRYSFDISM